MGAARDVFEAVLKQSSGALSVINFTTRSSLHQCVSFSHAKAALWRDSDAIKRRSTQNFTASVRIDPLFDAKEQPIPRSNGLLGLWRASCRMRSRE